MGVSSRQIYALLLISQDFAQKPGFRKQFVGKFHGQTMTDVIKLLMEHAMLERAWGCFRKDHRQKNVLFGIHNGVIPIWSTAHRFISEPEKLSLGWKWLNAETSSRGCGHMSAQRSTPQDEWL